MQSGVGGEQLDAEAGHVGQVQVTVDDSLRAADDVCPPLDLAVRVLEHAEIGQCRGKVRADRGCDRARRVVR